jgi:TraG P-loop domain
MIPRLVRKFQRTNELDGRTFDRELSPLALTRGVVINQDRSLGCGFRLDPPYTPTVSDEGIAGAYAALGGFLNALPEHFDLQVTWTQHARCAEFEQRLAGSPFSAGLVGDVQREQQENLLGLLREGQLRWIEVYLVLVRKLPESDAALRRMTAARAPGRLGPWRRVRDFFTGARERFQYDREQFAAAAAELQTQARTLAAALDNLGWSPAALEDDAVTRLFFQRWNPRQFEAGASPRPSSAQADTPFTERFVQGDFRWDPAGVAVPAGMAELDGWLHAVLTLYEPPAAMGRPIFEDLLLLGGLFRTELVVNAERGDRLARLKRLKILLQQRQSDPATAADPAERAATQQLTQELEEMGANSEGTWRAACYLHLWAPGAAELRDQIAATLALARARDMVFIHERRALWAYWRAMQPFWTQDKDRFRLLDYSTGQLLRLLPLFGQPVNLPEGKAIGVLYQTASRSIFNWIVPDESLFANPHYLIVGGTGSGKSVLQDENLIAMRRRGAKAIIIDLGGSFLNFCECSGGVYIDYDVRSRANRLNPLWLPPGTAPDAEMLRSLALWLESLARERGQRLPGDDLVVLEDALRRAYHRDLQQPVFLRHVRAALLRDERGARLAHRLSPWCEDGSLANLFDGPSQVDLAASVLVFDLKRVIHDQRDEDLARVIFNSIVGAVSHLSLAAGPEPKFLTFDEAGVMLRDEATAEFMEYCFRTLRKTGVAVCAIAQGLEDFLGNPRARSAFVGAADNLFVLKQDNHDKARLIAEEKNLCARELSYIQSVNTVPGHHAEFLLVQKTPQGQRTLHLASGSTPLKYAFTGNSREDRRILEGYRREGLTRPEAVRRFAREHPRGVLSSRDRAAG